jgi:phosphatidate cytidylyltransferase
LPHLTAVETAGIAVVLAIIGTMGDLMLSALKRDLNLKDWSQMLPGHGGILDRVDSFILVAPATYWMMLMLGF